MKKTLFRCFCTVLVMTLMMLQLPAVMAVPMEHELILGANYEERFYSYEPKTWAFTPSETGEYLLLTPGSGSLLGEIVGQTPTEEYSIQTGMTVQVYTLTAGTEYQVRIRLSSAYTAPYSDIFQLDKKQPLQSISLNTTEFTGRRDDYSSIYAELYPSYYALDGLTWTSSDPSVVSIESTENHQCFFRMNKVGTAVLTARIKNLTASCTITVEKAIGYWDDYPVWPADRTQMQVTLTANQGCAYSYTPTQSGVYAVHGNGGVHVDIHGTSPSHILNERTAHTLEGDYSLVDLVAGETYVLGVNVNYTGGTGPQTGMVLIEKARPAKAITLYAPNKVDGSVINGYVGGIAQRFAVSDPIYAYALDGGFRFASANSSIVDVEQAVSEGGNNIFLTAAGSCNLMVTTGNTTYACPVNVKPSPVLEVGKTTTLTFEYQDAYGVTCLFTPGESGNYTFTVKGSGGTCYIEETNIANYIFESGSMGGWLQGGHTYRVVLGVGNSDHTVTVYGSGNKPPVVTPPPQGSDDPQEPSVPTQPVDPSEPSVPTEPVDPSEPSVPTEPVDPLEPSAPTEPMDPSMPSSPTEPQNPSIPVDPDVPQANPEAEELAGQLGGSYNNGAIELDAQNGNVNLSAQDVALLAQMGVDLAVESEGFTIKLNSTALNALAGKAAGNVELRIRKTDKQTLLEAQKTALKDKNVAGLIAVDLTCNGSAVHDLGGGQALVTVPYTAKDSDTAYAVYYVAPDGTLEKMENVSCSNGVLTFRTGHFSEYAIIEESMEEEAEQPKLLLPILLAVAAVALVAAVVVILRRKK